MLEELILEHGDEYAVEKLPKDAHERIDPHSELAEKVHPSKIITIGPEGIKNLGDKKPA